MKVFIIDDHDSVRESYKRCLESFGYEVIGESRSFEEFLKVYKKNYPDIILMDIEFPTNQLGGIESAEELLKKDKNLKIVFVTHYTEPEIIRKAIKAGAIGYFTKADGLNCLKEAIENAYKGILYISPTAIKNIINSISEKDIIPSGHHKFNLSEEEINILNLVASGLTNKEIANQLHTNEKRIKNIISNIIYKLGAKNRANAVAIGIKYGIIKI
mgnify:CR=1 FL=1